MSGEVAAAGFSVARCADWPAPPPFPSEAASTLDDGRTEALPSTSRRASTTFLSTALRTVGISLCLRIATLGRILLLQINSRLKLAAGATLEAGIQPE